MTPYYDKNGITIYCGDCSDVMKSINSNSIDLTVTSPPYDNLRDYKGYYKFNFELVSQELWRVTSDGGVVVWVVGDSTINGNETGTSFKQALYFKEIGFNLHDTMIYSKKFSPLNHNRYEQTFEYMFVLSKNKVKTFNPILEYKKTFSVKKNKSFRKERDGSVDYGFSSKKTTKIKGNIWFYNVGYGGSTKDKIAFNHPAVFPDKLAYDHIISWSNEEDIILDPFMGSGTTLKMAKIVNRKAIGIDISEDYCKIAVERLKEKKLFQIPEIKENEKENLF